MCHRDSIGIFAFRCWKAWPFLNEGLDQEDGLRDLPNWTAQAPAFIAHTPVRFTLRECEALLQKTFCALHQFAVFELLPNLAGLFLELHVRIRQMRTCQSDAHLLPHETQQRDLVGGVHVGVAMMNVDHSYHFAARN